MVDVQLSFSSLPTQDNDTLNATEIGINKDGVDTMLEKSESFFQREEVGTEEEPEGKDQLRLMSAL